MQTKTIALTRAEATIIAQRALLERIEGSLGIWSHLKERMRPGPRNNGARSDGPKMHGRSTAVNCCRW